MFQGSFKKMFMVFLRSFMLHSMDMVVVVIVVRVVVFVVAKLS